MPDEGSFQGSKVESIPEPKRTQVRELIIQAMISEGHIESTLEIALSFGRKLTSDELESILERQISFGYFDGMEKTLQYLERSISDKELVNSIETLIRQGKLLVACKVAVKLPKSLMISQLKIIHKEQLSIGLSDCAKETDKLINESI